MYTTAPDTTKMVYDGAHRQIQVTDPLGQSTSQTYDASDNVLTSTDENGNTTYSTYDAGGELVKTVEPFDPGTGRTLTTIYRYDALGNVSKLITPRAYDASPDKVTFTDFVTTYSYDALNRLVRTTLPSQGGANVAYLHNAYDANGNLLWTSLPTTQSNPANVAAGDKTVNQYWDTGDLYSTQAPAAPKIRYDYTAEGWQSVRIPETAIGSGIPDYGRMVLWSYFADGKLKEQVDEIGLRDTFSYDLNGNQISTTEALGQGAIGSAQPITVTATYDALNQLTKVLVPQTRRPATSGRRSSATTSTATRRRSCRTSCRTPPEPSSRQAAPRPTPTTTTTRRRARSTTSARRRPPPTTRRSPSPTRRSVSRRRRRSQSPTAPEAGSTSSRSARRTTRTGC